MVKRISKNKKSQNSKVSKTRSRRRSRKVSKTRSRRRSRKVSNKKKRSSKRSRKVVKKISKRQRRSRRRSRRRKQKQRGGATSAVDPKSFTEMVMKQYSNSVSDMGPHEKNEWETNKTMNDFDTEIKRLSDDFIELSEEAKIVSNPELMKANETGRQALINRSKELLEIKGRRFSQTEQSLSPLPSHTTGDLLELSTSSAATPVANVASGSDTPNPKAKVKTAVTATVLGDATVAPTAADTIVPSAAAAVPAKTIASRSVDPECFTVTKGSNGSVTVLKVDK